MSDDATPGQISAPLHKHGHDALKMKGPRIPGNPLLVTQKHIEEEHTPGSDGNTLSRVHITNEAVATFEMTPPHPPRVTTAAYKKAHDYLIDVQNKPCVICGVSKATLDDPAVNRFKAVSLETHHYPIERSLMDACDPDKIHHTYPEVIDRQTLEAFVDSPRNLIVLCDVHHRSLEQGIHHLLTQDYAILPYLFDNYQIVATAKDKNQCETNDDQIEKQHGLE